MSRQPEPRPQASKQPQQLNLERDVNRAIELLDKLQRTEYNAWLSKDVDLNKLKQLQKVCSHLIIILLLVIINVCLMLKQVLQSDFFSAVREVYERVYETVDINGSPDIKANATAKATVAVFAASEGHSHPRIVELPKTDEGLGFNIMGGKEQDSAIYISRIISGGVADRHGGLRKGDQLLSVNGVNVEGDKHEKAVELLKAAQDKVILVVRYTPKILEELESRFDKTSRVHHKKSRP